MALQRSGLTITNTTFTGDTKATLMSGIRSNLLAAGMTSIQGAAPTTVSITIASPGVFTMTTGSAPVDGTRVVFTTTGALPTGVTAATVYFVKSPSGSTFNIATTNGGAAVNLSGSQSGTHTAVFECIFETILTPQNIKARFRFRDNGANCITVSLDSALGTGTNSNDTTNGIHLLPGTNKTWRIICSGYYWYLLVPGNYATSREFGCGHVPWLPATLTTGNCATYEAALLVGQGLTDSSGTVPASWRNSTTNAIQNATPNWQALWNSNFNSSANSFNNNTTGSGSAPTQYTPSASATTAGGNRVMKYSDGSFIVNDPWVQWGSIFNDSDARVRGMMWDCCFIQDNSPSGDTVGSFDGNTWTAITHLAQPTLWVISA